MKGTVWTLIAVLVSAGLWFALKDAPRNQPLNRQVWQSDVTAANGLHNPRRDMVGAVQRWVRTAHPSREVVRAALGAPDGARTEGDSWMGSAATAPSCCAPMVRTSWSGTAAAWRRFPT